MASTSGGPFARVYAVETSGAGSVRLALADVILEDVELSDGQLRTGALTVESRCVLFLSDQTGELFGRPMEPLALRDGALCFGPSAGGVRTRENRLAAGAFNEQVAEAARFGMVNALYHSERAARYVNGLLLESGAHELPPLHVVVSAHPGSRVRGYGQGDADYRQGPMKPLQGGHYRVSSRTTGIPEPIAVRPTGEVHLGAGRHRAPFAGHLSYLRNASHNPATIYHEFGHHLCRHTADFRLNAERSPGSQRNGKTGPEEGVCDYVAASLLGTGRPYGWYRPSRGERRDPELRRSTDAGDESDSHAVGARWAGVFWRTRRALLEGGLITSPRDHDRALVQALLAVGDVSSRPRDRRRRRERAVSRASPETIAAAYVEALRACVGEPAGGIAEGLFADFGLGANPLSVEDFAC